MFTDRLCLAYFGRDNVSRRNIILVPFCKGEVY